MKEQKPRKKWKRLSRSAIFESAFLSVYSDAVLLPSKKIIEDYTVIKKPDIVMIVATTQKKDLIVLEEYKYGANKFLYTLPAGHLEENEKPLDAARRELLEETGFSSNKFTFVGELHEYPSKDLHKVYIVKAENAFLKSNGSHEITENISVNCMPLEKVRVDVKSGKWKISSALSALLLSNIL